MLLNGMPIPREKPPLTPELAMDLPQGVAECFDGEGRFLGAVTYATKPPMETRRIRLAPEDFFRVYPVHRG